MTAAHSQVPRPNYTHGQKRRATQPYATQRAAYAVPECAHEVQCELRHIYFVYTNRSRS